MVEVDEEVGCDESSESTGVRSSVTARLVATTHVAVPFEITAPAGGRVTASATSLRGAAMRKFRVHQCTAARILREVLLCLRPATSAGVSASGGTASPGASVESSPFVSEED